MSYTADQIELLEWIKQQSTFESTNLDEWASIGVTSIESYLRHHLVSFLKQVRPRMYENWDFDSMSVDELEKESDMVFQEEIAHFGYDLDANYIAPETFESMVEEVMVEYSVDEPTAIRKLAAKKGCMREDWDPITRATEFCDAMYMPPMMIYPLSAHLT